MMYWTSFTIYLERDTTCEDSVLKSVLGDRLIVGRDSVMKPNSRQTELDRQGTSRQPSQRKSPKPKNKDTYLVPKPHKFGTKCLTEKMT